MVNCISLRLGLLRLFKYLNREPRNVFLPGMPVIDVEVCVTCSSFEDDWQMELLRSLDDLERLNLDKSKEVPVVAPASPALSDSDKQEDRDRFLAVVLKVVAVVVGGGGNAVVVVDWFCNCSCEEVVLSSFSVGSIKDTAETVFWSVFVATFCEINASTADNTLSW